MSKKIQEYIKQYKTIIILVCLGILTFLIRAIPHLFLIPVWCPADEQTHYITVSRLVTTGTVINPLFYPHGTHYFVYFLYLISRIDPILLCQYTNPLISGLTIIPMYFLLKSNGKHKAFVGCLIFAFAEAHIYRSSYFGTTEPLAILFGLTALTLAVQNKLTLSILALIGTGLSHLLPLVVFGSMIILYYLLNRDKKVIILLMLFSAIMFVYVLLGFQQISIIAYNVNVDVSIFKNLLIYQLNEVLEGLWLFVGTTGLLILCLLSKSKPSTLTLSILIVSVSSVVMSWISYDSFVIAPPRMIVYFQLALIVWFVESRNYKWKNMFLGMLLLLTVVSINLSGFQRFLWVNDSITIGEYNAINWAEKNLDITSGCWWADNPVMVEIASRKPEIFLSSPNWGDTVLSSTWRLNVTIGQGKTKYKYALFSGRMENRAFFKNFTSDSPRATEVRIPLLDPFFGDIGWITRYNRDGVRIYERITNSTKN